jgi:DNA polymerase-1
VAFQPSYDLIGSLDELREYVARVTVECTDPAKPDGRACSGDIETGYLGDSRDKASLHPEENFIAGVSFTNSLKWSRYVPVGHDVGPNLDPRGVAELLYPLFTQARSESGQPLMTFHGGKFDLRVLRRWFNEQLGTDLDYQQFRLRSDTMLESYALAGSRLHGLKELTEEQEARDTSGFWHKQLELAELYPDKLTAKQRKQIRFNVLDPRDPKVVRYTCEDTVYALAHHRLRYPRLQQMLAESQAKGQGFIWKLEMAVLPVVCEMEDEGIWYDFNGMREWGRKAKDFADRYMEEVREDFGALRGEALLPTFNFGSPVQLRKLLYEDCGMPCTHWTKGGKTTGPQQGTDAKVALKGLSKTYPEVASFLKWKKLTKLYRDFLVKFEDAYGYAEDGRVHASLMQHGVPAGRFACNDPNYQQSPKKYFYTLRDGDEFKFNFRDMIGAPPGWYQLGYDLAQAELRAVAGMAHEQKMFYAFEHNVDVHSVTASLVFAVPVEEVTPDQRDVGKTLGLAMVYGLSEDGLADRLGISRAEAADLFAAFHAAYPKIKAFTEECIKTAYDTGYVTTWWGRQVRIWDIDSTDRRKRRDAQRTAGNAPVQGSATGDYMKIAMVRSEAALRKAGLKDKVRLVMNIHDALEWYVRNDVDFNDVIAVLEPAIIFPVPGWPPMLAEWHAGRRWGSVRTLEKGPDSRYRFAAGAVKPETDIDLSEEDEDDVAPAPVLPALAEIRSRREEPDYAGTRQAQEYENEHGHDALPPAREEYESEHGHPVPRTVIVELTGRMPQEAVPELVRYCRVRTGPNTLVLVLPDGERVIMTGTCGVAPADQADLSVICGGAVVRYDEASVDLTALGAGLEL